MSSTGDESADVPPKKEKVLGGRYDAPLPLPGEPSSSHCVSVSGVYIVQLKPASSVVHKIQYKHRDSKKTCYNDIKNGTYIIKS